jgi:hypothetical protein
MAKTLVHPTEEMKKRIMQFDKEPGMMKILNGVMHCHPEALNGVPIKRTTLDALLCEAESLRDFSPESFKTVMRSVEKEPQYRSLREKICLLACTAQIARNCRSQEAVSYALEVARIYGLNALEDTLQQSQAHLEKNPDFLIDELRYKLKTMGRIAHDTIPYATAH